MPGTHHEQVAWLITFAMHLLNDSLKFPPSFLVSTSNSFDTHIVLATPRLVLKFIQNQRFS